jgi:spore coat polysaccharide biosynthesis predicted glycosyltransferase SpsG
MAARVTVTPITDPSRSVEYCTQQNQYFHLIQNKMYNTSDSDEVHSVFVNCAYLIGPDLHQLQIKFYHCSSQFTKLQLGQQFIMLIFLQVFTYIN